MHRLVWLIAAIAISMPCVAQSPPRIGIDMTTTTAPLSAEQKAALQQYADFFIEAMQGDELSRAERARDDLLRPLSTPGVTVLFRDEYSRVLVPMLDQVLQKNNNHFAAVNAMQVVAQLGTVDALALAMRHASQQSEPRVYVRIWAAKAFHQMAGPISQNNILARRVDIATRDLARAAKQEESWLALLRQLQALGGLDTQVARDEERDVLANITGRMTAQEGPSELVHALYPAVVGLRARMIEPGVPAAKLTAMGKNFAPVLAQILEVAEEHWDEVQDSEDSHSKYGSLVGVTESAIERIDAIVATQQQRGPDTQLQESWERRDKARFEQDVELWMDRIESPVYKP